MCSKQTELPLASARESTARTRLWPVTMQRARRALAKGGERNISCVHGGVAAHVLAPGSV